MVTNDSRSLGGTMFTRMLILTLIAVLALPISTLTTLGEVSQAPRSQSAVAAKGNHHKNKVNKKTKTVTRTIRQPVTRTFTNAGSIITPNGAPCTTRGNANPYPAAINVSGFANGVITD